MRRTLRSDAIQIPLVGVAVVTFICSGVAGAQTNAPDVETVEQQIEEVLSYLSGLEEIEDINEILEKIKPRG